MDDDKVTEAVKSLGAAPAAKELYVDLLRPAAAESGKNLLLVAKVVTIALTPLQGMVWGLERVRDWVVASLSKRFASIAPDQIQPPPPHIAGPILLQLSFCAEQEQLRELYANLLAAAMKKDTATSVHPAFVQVVQQITPDEAVILARIAAHLGSFSLSETWTESGRPSEGGEPISKQFQEFCKAAGVSTLSLADAYLDNLLRLKVLTELHWSEGKFHPSGYTRYGDHPAYVDNVDGRLVEMSAFGEAFIRTCVVPIEHVESRQSGV